MAHSVRERPLKPLFSSALHVVRRDSATIATGISVDDSSGRKTPNDDRFLAGPAAEACKTVGFAAFPDIRAMTAIATTLVESARSTPFTDEERQTIPKEETARWPT